MRVTNVALIGSITLISISCEVADGDSQPADEANSDQAFEQAYQQFAAAYGDDKADVFGDLGVNKCELLAPLFEYGDWAASPGFVIGAEGEGFLGPAAGFAGIDVVFDFRHHQATGSKYAGIALGPNVGVEVGGNAYVGAAFGFSHGVSDWDGGFVLGAASFGLPFLKEFASVRTEVFNSADALPPHGIAGFTVGVEVGATIIPDPEDFSPIEGSLGAGQWVPHDELIRWMYDRLESRSTFGIFPIDVRLVDHHTGADCLAQAPQWPRDSDLACVLEFGRPGQSNLQRALSTAAAICEFTNGCTAPLSWRLAVTSLAVGALWDGYGPVRAACGLEEGSGHESGHGSEHGSEHGEGSGHPTDDGGLSECLECISQSGGTGCVPRCRGVLCQDCLGNHGGTGCIPQCISDACTLCLGNNGGTGCLERCDPDYLGTDCSSCVEQSGGTGCTPRCGPE